MRIYRRISKKKYVSKALYEYERFFVPVPKRYHDVIRTLLGKDVKVKIEPAENGLVIRVQIYPFPRANSQQRK